MSMRTMTKSNKLANELGLCVTKYNPGDNLTYKVQKGLNKDYFEGGTVFIGKTLSHVDAFLSGYVTAIPAN